MTALWSLVVTVCIGCNACVTEASPPVFYKRSTCELMGHVAAAIDYRARMGYGWDRWMYDFTCERLDARLPAIGPVSRASPS